MAAEGSTLKVEDLEDGKRYRISFDGVWDNAAYLTGVGWQFSRHGLLPYASSIEKLPDPEPEWKHGVVVKVPGYSLYPFIYDADGGVWRTPTNGHGGKVYGDAISTAFQAGTLEILYQPE